jgi:hypothetical protein
LYYSEKGKNNDWRPVDQERRTREHGSEPRIPGAFSPDGIECVSKRIRADSFLGSLSRFLCRCPIAHSHASHRPLTLGPDPLGVTIGKALVFPDRHGILDLVDDLPTSIECLSALGAGHGHDYGDVTDLEITDTVNR